MTGEKRISKPFGIIIVVIAVFFDVLSAIPWVGLIAAGLGYLLLGFMFLIKRVNPVGFSSKKKKRLASFASEWIAGVLGFGIWPGITAWAIITIRDSRKEDEENENQTKQKVKEKIHQRIKQTGRRKKTSAYQ